MDKSKLLDRVAATGEDRLLLARILDKWEQADRRGTPACTDFLSPRERIAAENLLRLAGVPADRWCISGGYANAERTMLAFLPDRVIRTKMKASLEKTLVLSIPKHLWLLLHSPVRRKELCSELLAKA